METKQLIEATCPECRGPLSEMRHGDLREYRCMVGHVFTVLNLLEAHSDVQEKALWSAVVCLEEAAKLVRAVAPSLPDEISERLTRQAEKKARQAEDIRKILDELEPFQVK